MVKTKSKLKDREIVEFVNALAWDVYAKMGYHAPDGYRFYESFHPQEKLCWRVAAHIYEKITYTDVENALNTLWKDN